MNTSWRHFSAVSGSSLLLNDGVSLPRFRAHWYLVIICFPGLDEPKVESWTAGSPSEETVGRSEADAEMNCSNSVEAEAGGT